MVGRNESDWFLICSPGRHMEEAIIRMNQQAFGSLYVQQYVRIFMLACQFIIRLSDV